LSPEIQSEADALIERLVERTTFDAVSNLARHLPLTIVSTRVGLPEDGRENMLEWEAANFKCFGPMNDRAKATFPRLEEGVRYSFDPSLPARLKPGSWASRLWEAADEGEIAHDKCPAMLNDYWSLDTTIFATACAIWLFGKHPDQWDLLRADRTLLPHGVNEVVRLESPIPQFPRVTTRDYVVDGITIPAGSRVLVMYPPIARSATGRIRSASRSVVSRTTTSASATVNTNVSGGRPHAWRSRSLLDALAGRVAPGRAGRGGAYGQQPAAWPSRARGHCPIERARDLQVMGRVSARTEEDTTCT
jgi:Cytochrome P450